MGCKCIFAICKTNIDGELMPKENWFYLCIAGCGRYAKHPKKINNNKQVQ